MGHNTGESRTAVEKSRELQEKFFYEIGLLAYKDGDLTDSEVARRAGVSASYYSGMKNLRKSISLSAMISIARVFGMVVHVNIVPKK